MYPKSQLRKVFGKAVLPVIDLTLQEVTAQARRLAGRLSISGVQPKLSVILKSGELIPVAEKGRYILKPQTMPFPELPENEYLCMQLAENCGIKTAPNILLKLKDDTWAYVVKRFDRLPRNKKLPCEDMAQIIGADKYNSSYEAIGNVIKTRCEFPGLDLQYFFEQVVFCFVIGDGDAHLKNFSLLTINDKAQFSPAYDLVSSRLVIPEENEELALTLNGRRNKIQKKDFLAFANTLKIAEAFANSCIQSYLEKRQVFFELIKASQLAQTTKTTLTEIVNSRLTRLTT